MREMVDRMPSRDVGATRRAPHLPTLSVVLLSQGDRSALERALAAVAARCRRMEAEIIVVRPSTEDELATLGAAYPSVTFLGAPNGMGSTQMRELGMNRATGDIVSLRMDGTVGDGMWLDAFGGTMGCVDDDVMVEVEVPLVPVVDDTAIAAGERRRGRAYLAPSVAASPSWRSEPVRPSVGIAGLESDARVMETSNDR